MSAAPPPKPGPAGCSSLGASGPATPRSRHGAGSASLGSHRPTRDPPGMFPKWMCGRYVDMSDIHKDQLISKTGKLKINLMNSRPLEYTGFITKYEWVSVTMGWVTFVGDTVWLPSHVQCMSHPVMCNFVGVKKQESSWKRILDSKASFVEFQQLGQTWEGSVISHHIIQPFVWGSFPYNGVMGLGQKGFHNGQSSHGTTSLLETA